METLLKKWHQVNAILLDHFVIVLSVIVDFIFPSHYFASDARVMVSNVSGFLRDFTKFELLQITMRMISSIRDNRYKYRVLKFSPVLKIC